MLSVRRNTVIVIGVLLLHLAALWVLQGGLLRQAVEVIVPVEVLSEFIASPSPPPSPTVSPPAPPPPARSPQAMNQAPARAPAPPHPNEPQPATASAAPVAASTGPALPSPGAAPATAPTLPSPSGTPRAPQKVELPSSDAQYLRNPKPVYPALSKRLGEQGKVVIRVLIDVDGSAQQAEVLQSSGFERLDQAALKTVLGWRFVPGKRGGVAEAMWFNIPLNFVLE